TAEGATFYSPLGRTKLSMKMTLRESEKRPGRRSDLASRVCAMLRNGPASDALEKPAVSGHFRRVSTCRQKTISTETDATEKERSLSSSIAHQIRRDLGVERFSIRHRRTNHHAWHSVQAARRREGWDSERAAPPGMMR